MTEPVRIENLIRREMSRASPTSAKVARIPASVDAESLIDDDSISMTKFAIADFLPKSGLLLLGGRPKEGKTWLACQIALSTVTGHALGDRLTVIEPGRCHLWALEDQYPITKDKLRKLLGGTRPDGLRDLRIFADLPQPLLRGGDQIIRTALAEHPAEVIILDSLFKLTGGQQQHQDISQRDYDVIDRVRKIALDHKCAVVVVMHTRKGSRGGDPIENLLGTSGNTAAADVVCELKRTGYNGKLTVVGRVVQREDYHLLWHEGDKWGWTLESQGNDAAVGETSEEILAYLEAQGATKPAIIAAALRKSFPATWMCLKRLQERGKVTRGRDKKWELAK